MMLGVVMWSVLMQGVGDVLTVWCTVWNIALKMDAISRNMLMRKL
jgi:hypothetical protein